MHYPQCHIRCDGDRTAHGHPRAVVLSHASLLRLSMLLVHRSLTPCSHPRAVTLSHASQARCSSFTPPLAPAVIPAPSLSHTHLRLDAPRSPLPYPRPYPPSRASASSYTCLHSISPMSKRGSSRRHVHRRARAGLVVVVAVCRHCARAFSPLPLTSPLPVARCLPRARGSRQCCHHASV